MKPGVGSNAFTSILNGKLLSLCLRRDAEVPDFPPGCSGKESTNWLGAKKDHLEACTLTDLGPGGWST